MTRPLACLAGPLADGLIAITRSPGQAAIGRNLRRLLSALYPLLLAHHAQRGKLKDFPDLQRSVTAGIPVQAATHILDQLDTRTELGSYLTRVLQLFVWRLDRTGPPADPLRDAEPRGRMIARLLVELETDVRDFSVKVLVGGAPTKPASPIERAAARQSRLSDFKRIWSVKGYSVLPDKEIYRLAGVECSGRGSGLHWKNGSLPDNARACTKIEDLLSFRVTAKPLPCYRVS